MVNTELRKQEKKLRQFVEKNPGVQNDEYHELRRKVIVLKVKIEMSARKNQERVKKEEERNKFYKMTEEEVLNQAYQENAQINAKNRKAAKNKEKKEKKNKEIQEKKEEDMKKFYEEVIQPQLAKHIIMSIVQQLNL